MDSNIMIVYEYDYDKREIREYERQGECSKCGACCDGGISFLWASSHSDEKDIDTKHLRGCNSTDGTGVWTCLVRGLGDVVFYKTILTSETHRKATPCPALKDNLCSHHGPDKLPICAVWPLTPHDVRFLPMCSYTFVLVKTQPMGG